MNPCADSVGVGHIIGLNAYYLQEEATRALRKGEEGSPILDEILRKTKELGANLIRTNGHNDALSKVGDSAIQIAPLEFDEIALQGLDLVLHRACQSGVQLILPLGNHWDAYGGAKQYVEWSGFSDATQGDSRFYTDASIIAHYKGYIQSLMERRNSYDGILYSDHPAVFAWEILNEPRGSGGVKLDRGGEQMREWVDSIASHIKALAPDHLVGTGEEGFDISTKGYDAKFWRDATGDSDNDPYFFRERSSFTLNTASPFIDLASVHLYPEGHGYAGNVEETEAAGCRWIEEHAAIANAAGKELLLGEFGLRNRDGNFDSLEDRRRIYQSWFDCARRAETLAAMPWLIAHDSRPDDWDDYTFYFKDGSQPGDPENRYADLIQEATK